MSGLRPLLLVLPVLSLMSLAPSPGLAQSNSPAEVSGTSADATPQKSTDGAQQALSLSTLQDEATARLKASADAGDAGAAMSLARLYSGVDSGDDEAAQAVHYLEQASAAGIVEAQVWLGDLYRNGSGVVDADPLKAAEFYQAALDRGDSYSGEVLATMLQDGTLPRDPARARATLEAAARVGSIHAATMLARLLVEAGEGVQAQDLLGRGVLVGDNDAMVALADLYVSGKAGIAVARDKAILLYYTASRQGDMGAAHKLADLYLEGEGEVVNLNGAVQLLEQVAANGDVTALIELGDLFSNGEKAKIDAHRAAEYYEQASEIGSIEALLRLGNLFRNGTEDLKPSATKAIPYFEEAADSGDNTARKTLAQMLIAGEGFAPDPTRARELLQAAADAGDSEAAQMLIDLDNPPPLPTDTPA